MNVRVAVDTVVLSLVGSDEPGAAADDTPSLRVLAVRRREPPYAGCWALPGRTVADREGLDEAVVAALAAQTGVSRLRHIEQLATFGQPGRDPRGRVVSVTYLGLVPAPVPPSTGAAWLDPAAPDLGMAFDHRELVEAGISRLRSKLGYSNVAYGLLPDAFTLAELQRVYEAVLHRTLDKRNFRRKVLGLGLLAETGGVRRGAHRPASLYRFVERELVTIDTAAIA